MPYRECWAEYVALSSSVVCGLVCRSRGRSNRTVAEGRLCVRARVFATRRNSAQFLPATPCRALPVRALGIPTRAATLTFPQLTASLTYAIFRDRRARAGGRRNDAGRHARNRHRWGRLEVAQRPGGAERPTTACTHAGHAFPFIEAAVDQCSQLPRGPVRCAAPPRPLSRQLTARTRLAASSSMPGARKRHSSWR